MFVGQLAFPVAFIGLTYAAPQAADGIPPLKVAYNIIPSMPDQSPVESFSQVWHPVLNYHHESCVCFPAVTSNGEVSSGIAGDAGRAENNDNCNTSVGQPEYITSLMASYFPKGFLAGNSWHCIILWFKPPADAPLPGTEEFVHYKVDASEYTPYGCTGPYWSDPTYYGQGFGTASQFEWISFHSWSECDGENSIQTDKHILIFKGYNGFEFGNTAIGPRENPPLVLYDLLDPKVQDALSYPGIFGPWAEDHFDMGGTEFTNLMEERKILPKA